MNYYEIAFIGFDGDCYNVETKWLVKSDRSYDGMLDYIHDLNAQFKEKYPNSKSYFIFNEEEVLVYLPDIDKIEADLKDL